RRVLVAFAARAARESYARLAGAHAVAHVGLEDAVLDQRGFLRRAAFVVNADGTPRVLDGAVIDRCHRAVRDLLTELAREGRGLAAHAFGFQQVTAGFVKDHAAEAIPHHHGHLATLHVTRAEHAHGAFGGVARMLFHVE